MRQARKRGAEGLAGEANYRTRLEAARSLFRDLAKRGEPLAARNRFRGAVEALSGRAR